jgi:uracil DNA glycosylase
MSIELKIKDTIKSLDAKYQSSEWNKTLTKIINNPQTEVNLLALAKSGKPFNPVLKYMFAPFDKCKLSELKAVLINTNPTEKSNGLAFSSLEHTEGSKAFSNIFYPKGLRFDYSYLASKGMLLFNKNIIVSSDESIVLNWDYAIDILLDDLKFDFNLTYILVGEENEKYSKQLSSNTCKFFLPMPSESWVKMDIVNKINKIIKNNYGEELIE